MRRVARRTVVSLATMIMLNADLAAEELLLVDATVNHRSRGPVFLLKGDDGAYYAAAPDLSSWGIGPPYADTVVYAGYEFVRLDSLGDIGVSYDSRNATAAISIPAALLPTQSLFISSALTPEAVSSTGAYLDYDVSYTSGDASYSTGLFSPTFFSDAGVIQTQVLYLGYDPAEGYLATGSQEPNDWIRLDTTYTRDIPGKMRSIYVGDTIAAPGLWGSAQRVGGVQVASNFSTRPTFVSFPLPSLSGSAGLPSTLDLYINGTLRHRENLEAGPFRADEIPVVTGAGQMQVVVTDVLGREQIYTQSFYAGAALLRKGLSEYSYSLGALRESYGYSSSDYGETALLAEHRYGYSDELTVGARAELSGSVQHLSARADWSPRFAGVLSFGLGLSATDDGHGSGWLVGYDYRARNISVGARASGTSAEFGTVGMNVLGPIPKTQLVVNGGWQHGVAGSFGAALVRMSYHDGQQRDVFTLSHSKTLAQRYYYSLYANYVDSGSSDFSFGISVSTSFGMGHNASASAYQNDSTSSFRLEAQSSPPIGPGIGYRIGKTIGDLDRFDARFVGQTHYGRHLVETDRFGGSSSTRIGTSGSIAWLAGRPYFAREINEGFAVARVGRMENVRVYLENQEVGRTDREGRLLLPRLRPYETNRIRIEPIDLPLAAEVQTVSKEIAPAFRSGVIVDFPVVVSSFALVRAMLPSGRPVPSGTAVILDGRDTPSVVGLDGTVYAAGVPGKTTISIDLPSGRCSFEIELPAQSEVLQHLGDFECAPNR